MTMDTLPDDVILEILARVPDAPALLRCAAACIRWRALVINTSFLRRRWPDPVYAFLGSFDPKTLNRGDKGLATQRSALDAGHRLLGSFVPAAAGLPADHVWPMTSYGGLILSTLYSHNHDEVGGVPLAVCSLLAGTCVVLPPFKWDIHSIGHAVLSGADGRPPFKVLMIVAAGREDETDTDYELHTFVAGQPSWNAPTKCPSRAALGHLMHSEAVVCQGAAHWLFCASSSFHVLRVDAETGRISSTKLTSPISSDFNVQRESHHRSRLATTTDGKLLSLCLYNESLQVVEIWTQPASGHGQDWPRTGVIDLKPILGQHQEAPYIWLGGRCGNGKLLVTLAHRQSYIANLQTGTMQEVESSSGCITRSVVCVEIDWTTFFMARLACTNQP